MKVVGPATVGLRSGENLVCDNLALAKGLDIKGAILPTVDCLRLLLAYDDAWSSSRKPTNDSRCTRLFGPPGFDNRLARTSSLGYRTSS